MTIALGAEGHYVRAWQRVVLPIGKVPDGKFGSQTETYARAWQLRRGVVADGVLGPLSRAALRPDDLIKPFEYCVLQAYDDRGDAPLHNRLLHRAGTLWVRADGALCRGNPTIGWGKRLWGQVIEHCTQDQADQWLADDIRTTRGPYVLRYLPANADAGQVCAAYSLCYNAGQGGLLGVARAGFTQAAWMAYVHETLRDGTKIVNSGLVERRSEEWAMWTGTPGDQA